MALQGTRGSSGIPETPLLRSGLSGKTVRAGGGKQASIPAADLAETSARLAAALRRNHAFLQETQGAVTAARIALGSLDRLEAALREFSSREDGAAGAVTRESAADSVREIVERATFDGRPLLADLAPDGAAGGELSSDDVRRLLGRIEAARTRFSGELQNHLRALGSSEVERANLLAAAETPTAGSPAEAERALREAAGRLQGGAAAAAASNLDRGRIVQIL